MASGQVNRAEKAEHMNDLKPQRCAWLASERHIHGVPGKESAAPSGTV
jgi:hypothetical protein